MGAVQKTIYSLPALRQLLTAANRRFLEFLSTIEVFPQWARQTRQAVAPVPHEDRPSPGFNFFDASDDELFHTIARGEFNASGLQNKTLRRCLSGKTSAQVSRLLKRLRLHELIRKLGRPHKYYLTQLGKQVTTTGLKLHEPVLIPQLAFGQIA
jgi:hypothetical protein